MTPSATAGHRLRLLQRGGGLALAVTLLAITFATPGLAQEDPRTKEIREIEQKIAQLNAKIAELKAIDPTKGRQPLRLSDALAWRSISGVSLSRDGKWFACAILPGEGKGEVFVRQTAGDKEYRFKDVEGVGGVAFSHDGRWLAFSSTPKRRGPEFVGPLTPTQASGKVVLVNLTGGDKVEYEGVSRFQFSGPESNVLAIHRSPASPVPSEPTAGSTTPVPPAQRARGSDLILRDLAAGKDLTLGNVAEFGFDKKGSRLALLIDAQGRFGNGVQLRDMKSAALHQLETGKATYSSLDWTDTGDAFSLLKGEDQEGKTEKKYTILTCTNLASPALAAVDPAKAAGFPKDLVVSAGRPATFSDDRATVFFAISEPGKASTSEGRTVGKGKGKGKTEVAKATTPESTAKAGKPDLVIWHWNDSRLQSEQQKTESRDRVVRYLCAYHLKDGKFVRLADDAVRSVSVTPKDRYAIGMESRPYERSGSLDGKRLTDFYVIDVRTGERHVALKAARYYQGTSPDGNKFLYYEDGQFLVYDIPTKKSRVITKDVPTSFINTEDDHPVDRPPTRALGWTKDSSAVLLSDNWDVWKVPVAEGTAVNLTQNGKKDGIRYQMRVILDPEEKGADLTQPQVFTMYGEWTKKSGFLRLDPKSGPTALCWDDATFGRLAKAREADVYLFTRETVSAYPEYYSADASLKNPRRLTTANPDQDKFKFCSGSMLVDYESAKGDKLQGALFLPADYEKGKKYPTVVYIYERLSQDKNRYLMPRLTGGGFNASLYTSNGYAVFMPDIRYKLNDPGMSAVWCVMPALEAAINTGVVDRDRVGLHGHSWGGYQTAFLITQTPAFKAAVAGAPLTDLISMYSSIYWNVGIANQPIFESSQGRFTSGYWDQPEAYIRNSPVFHAKKVVTPLILLHNDKDGAVDFNQGIEYFNTLRRLDKPVVMLQYKGENHGLAKEANQKDYTVRMREFFDHHLQGKPAPAWLKEGVPHLKMDEHLKTRTFKE
jgi:dienelactone hydrolase